jgi:hypothetical protein
VGDTVVSDVDGVVEGDDVGTEDEGETVSCEEIGTVVGAKVGIGAAGETVGCEVVGTAVGAKLGSDTLKKQLAVMWWKQPWARKSGSLRPVKQ